MTASMRITSRGRVTIPKAVRDELGLREGDKVKFVKQDGGFRLEKDVTESPFDKWLGHLSHLEYARTDDLIEELRGPAAL